jgi:hypothetical protein
VKTLESETGGAGEEAGAESNLELARVRVEEAKLKKDRALMDASAEVQKRRTK